MHKLVEIVESLSDNEKLTVGLLTGPGIIQGFLVSENAYESRTRSSLLGSTEGGSLSSRRLVSPYQRAFDSFEEKGLGADHRGLTVPLVDAIVTMNMMAAKVPTMRLNPRQVVSWWVTEHEVDGATIRGGGLGIGF